MLKMVERRRLMDRIHPEPGSVTLITAPAGYGKTTLADQWAMTVGRTIVRLDIAPGRDAAAPLLAEVQQAVAHPGLPTADPADAALPARLLELAEAAGGVTVIVDDAHRLPDAELAVLLQGCLAFAHVVIVSRDAPRDALGLGRLHAIGRLTHITANDLRFSLNEVTEAVVEQGLSCDCVRQLTDRTEGWIMGVRLALAALASRGETGSSEQFGECLAALPRDRWLVQYLRGEMLDDLPDDLRAFVLLTTALPELTPDLCSAALEIDRADEVLQELALRPVFLTQVAPFAVAMRYHALVAEALVPVAGNELGIERLRKVWDRAATWLAERQRFGEALDLAIRSGNRECAIRYAEQVVQNPDDRDRVDIVQRRLGQLPRDVLLNNDTLAHAYIQAASYAGNLRDATSVADVMLPRWTASDDPELRGLGASTVGHLHVLDGDNQTAIDHLYEALRLTPDSRVLDQLHAWTAVSHLEFLRNNTDAAEHAYQEAARRRARLGRSPYMWEMFTRPDRANQLAMRGDLQAAEEMYRDLYLHATGTSRIPASKPLALLAAIYLQWGQYDQALDAIARMEDDQHTFPYDVWRPEGLTLAAQVYLDAGMPEQAERSLQTAIAMFQTRGGSRYLRRAKAIEALLWLRTGKKHRAREWADIEQHCPPVPSRVFRDFDPRLALIEVMLDDGRWADAAALARQGIDDAPSPNCNAPRLRFLVWHAVALAMGDALDQADMALREALDIGRAGPFIAAFHLPGYDLTGLLDRVARTVPPESQAFIDQLAGDRSYTPPPATHELDQPREGVEHLAVPLTPREREVLALVQRGQMNREIADQLFITERTVKKHIANICLKLDAPNRTAAAARAFEYGLLDHEGA